MYTVARQKDRLTHLLSSFPSSLFSFTFLCQLAYSCKHCQYITHTYTHKHPHIHTLTPSPYLTHSHTHTPSPLLTHRSAEHSAPLKRDLEASRKELATVTHSSDEANSRSKILTEELERLTRLSVATVEGNRVERIAMEARIERGRELLEAEIVLRRQVEGRAAECNKYENLYNRFVIEVNELSHEQYILVYSFCF